MITTIFGAIACPVYLLLDVETVWKEKKTVFEGGTHLAAYFFTPHNYVALCISHRFGEYKSVFYALGGFQIVADFAACYALGNLLSQSLQSGDNSTLPYPLVTGYVITAAGFLLFFGPMGVRFCYYMSWISSPSVPLALPHSFWLCLCTGVIRLAGRPAQR